MKALLLAAGLGTRLRPLTTYRPKPLCLFYGRPILDIVFSQLRRAGLDQIAINTHYLHEMIEQHVCDHAAVYTPSPKLSYEPEILGTGGCVNPLRAWLGADDLLIYNGDIVTDLKLSDLIAQHQQRRPDATMVLLSPHRPDTTPVYWDGARQIQGIGGSAPKDSHMATFSGIHILGSRLLEAIPQQGFQSVIDAYQTLLRAGGRIEVYVHRGFWADLGQPRDYLEAHLALLRDQRREYIAAQLGLTGIEWRLDSQSATVGQTYTGELSHSFLFGPLTVHGSPTIQHCIVYPHSQVPDQSSLVSRLITPELLLDLR